MAKKIIITIARQYGSGGREIGERVAALLNIPIFDKQLITDAASHGNLDEELLKKADETAANSLLYTLAMGSNLFACAHAPARPRTRVREKREERREKK